MDRKTETMERVRLTEDVTLSRIVYGLWRLGDDSDTTTARVQEKLETCLAQGITTMDQADIYGAYRAEEILGDALKAAPGLRDRIEIVTKCGIVAPVGRHAEARVKHYDTSRAHITASVESSLSLLGTDRIDLLLIHRPDPFMDHVETGATLDGLVASGKVRAVGVSNFRPWDFTLLQSAMETTLATNQIEISLLRHEPFTTGDIAFLQERGLPPMAWSPLAGGSLFANLDQDLRAALSRVAAESGTDEAAVAVAWLLAHPSGILPVMGTSRLDRIATLADARRVSLDRETWFELYTGALGREVA